MATFTVNITCCILVIMLTELIIVVNMAELDNTDQSTFQSKYDNVLCTCKKVDQENTIAATSVTNTDKTTLHSSKSDLYDISSSFGEKTAKSIFSTPSIQMPQETTATNTVELTSSLVILDQSADSTYNFQSTSGYNFLSTLDVNNLHDSIKTTASMEDMLTTSKTTVKRDAEFPSVATSGARVAVDLKSENLTVITVTVPAKYQQMSQEATVSVNVPSPSGGSHIALSITSVPSGTSGTITFSTATGDSVVSFMIPSEASGTAFAIEVPSKFSKRPTAKDSTRKAIIKIVHEGASGGADTGGENPVVTPTPKDENTVDAKGATRVESTTSVYQHTSSISTATGILNRTERAPTTFPADIAVTESTRGTDYIATTKTPAIIEQTTEKTRTTSTSTGTIIPTSETISTRKPTTEPQRPPSPTATARVTTPSTSETSQSFNSTWTMLKPTKGSELTNESSTLKVDGSHSEPTTTSTAATEVYDKTPMSSHWIRTVLAVSPNTIGNETFHNATLDGLRASYRKAYKQLHITNSNKNQTLLPDRSSEIDIQIVNSTYLNTTIQSMEFIYVVTLNGTAIDAQTAIDSLDMITEQEMAILLGHVVTLKAQPYSSQISPQPLQSDSGSVMLGAILGAIFGLLLLVVIAIILLRFNSARKRRQEQLLIMKEQQRQQELQESYGRRNRQIAFVMDDTYRHSEERKEKVLPRSGHKKMKAKRSRDLPSSAPITSQHHQVDKPQPKPRKKRPPQVTLLPTSPKYGESRDKLLKSTDSLTEQLNTTSTSQGIENMAAETTDNHHEDVTTANGGDSNARTQPRISRRQSKIPQIPILKAHNTELNAVPAYVDQCDTLLPNQEVHPRSYTGAKDVTKDTKMQGAPSPKLETKGRPHVHFGGSSSIPINEHTILNGPDEVDTAANLMAWNDPETRFLISSIKNELKKFKDSLPSPGPPFLDV